MKKLEEDARRSVAAPWRAAEAGTNGQVASDSTTYDTTVHGGGQMGIAGLLMHGASNGLHVGELVQLTGLPNRAVRKRIELERKSGVPILSDNQNGYFLPETEADIRSFVRSMKGRAQEILAVAAAVEGIMNDSGEMSEISPDFLQQVEDDCGGK